MSDRAAASIACSSSVARTVVVRCRSSGSYPTIGDAVRVPPPHRREARVEPLGRERRAVHRDVGVGADHAADARREPRDGLGSRAGGTAHRRAELLRSSAGEPPRAASPSVSARGGVLHRRPSCLVPAAAARPARRRDRRGRPARRRGRRHRSDRRRRAGADRRGCARARPRACPARCAARAAAPSRESACRRRRCRAGCAPPQPSRAVRRQRRRGASRLRPARRPAATLSAARRTPRPARRPRPRHPSPPPRWRARRAGSASPAPRATPR